ncbi:uncharacterized protein LOC127577746 [Pristis pectinata]|uniref:uncharacterized protein LOC127577746 n=1 Tax=Pristis pectinata TaxID=685728 RepID=UPI00223D98DA|nr:uncharacterized protein LOC127577746 [Pristis pectinata]
MVSAGRLLPRLVPRVVALFALLRLSEEGDLIVSMNSRTVEAVVNKDVLLECRVSGYKTSEIDLKNVGVQWFFEKFGSSTRKEVYQFNGGKHRPYRKGAAVFDDELKKGIASLFLPLVQFDEEGDYICVVFISPDSGRGKSSMTVSAIPQVTLSSTAITIENGTEKSVKCDSTGFYPLAIEMSWLKKSKDGEQNILKHICTASPVKNNDGTYNVSSHMRLRPSLNDDDSTYICFVRHRSLSNGIKLTTHLTVKEPEIVVPGGIIASSVIFCVLMCSLIMVIGFLMYLKYFRKVPPKVSDISKPPRIIHLEETVLNCQISGYKPQNISICWFLQRKGENQYMIHQCTSPSENLQAPKAIDQQRLISDYESPVESFAFEMSPVTNSSDGSSSVKCKVIFYPDINKDDEAVLELHVLHSTLGKPVIKAIRLKVEGIAPKMTNILVPPCIVHEEVTALSCQIDGFKPRPLAITWYQKQNSILKKIMKYVPGFQEFIAGNGKDHPKYSHTLNELQYEDHTHSIISVLVFTPTIHEDHDTVYICEVEHQSTASKTCKDVKLNVKAIPKCDDIKLSPEIPIVEEFAYASCRIYSFFPKNIKIIWKLDNKTLKEMNADSEAILGKDGRYSCTGRLKFIPEREHFGKILTCEFQHESIMDTKKIDCKLVQLISSPLMDSMEIEPQYPEPGKETTFLCRAYGFFPKDLMFMWFKNDKRIDDKEIVSTSPEIDKNTGFFYSESRWKYIISVEDHKIDFKVEALHFPTSHRPTRIFHTLHLGGIPKVSDVILEPENPLYGQRLVLKCNVTNFSHNGISTHWVIDEKPVLSGVRNIGPKMGKDGFYQLCSCLEFTPTALHYNKKFVFEVKNGVSSDPVKKQFCLPLPGYFPTVSEIKCNPTRLEENKVATFTVSLTHYVPPEIEVKWFKGEQPFTGPVDNSQPQITASGLYSSTSSIEFAPGPSDQDLEVRCEIFHSETSKRIEQRCHLTF